MTFPRTTPTSALEGTSQQCLRLSTGPIIIATDGTEASDSAIVAGRLLAARSGAPLQVVSAVEPIVIPTFDSDITTTASTESATPRRTAQREMVQDQLRRLLGASAESSVTLFDGDAASVLAKTAHDRRARMLVLGRGRHGMMGRLLIGETVLRVLQLADVPVLAVEPGLAALPQRVLIAIDFSPYSIYAARVAMSFVDPDATIYLTHVTSQVEQLAPGLELLAERDEGMQTAFARVRQQIGAEHRHVETVALRGHLGRALVDFAASKNVDLVVSGTHGYGFFNRLILGSVATQLVRGAPCSVLAVPGSAAIRAAMREQVGQDHTHSVPMPLWSTALAAFSRHNTNRHCRIEIDDTDLGAQTLGIELPLVGATFDRRDNDVQLVFGTSGRMGRALSHAVPNVSAIEILADPGGRDRALHLLTDRGSTLVTFMD